MRLATTTLLTGTLALISCATPLPPVSSVQPGDAQLSCAQLPQEIARLEALIAQTDQASTTGRLLTDIAEVGAGVLQGMPGGKLGDRTAYGMAAGGIDLIRSVMGMVTGGSEEQTQRTKATAAQRKALLTQFYYSKCQ